MVAEFGSNEWRYRKVQKWLLLLLRFAVTREPSDQSAALAMADELDSLGLRWRPAAPSFFLRTSHDVCAAILTVDNGHDSAVLRRHVARIDDPRLRRAFQPPLVFTRKPYRSRKAQRARDERTWTCGKAYRKNEPARQPLFFSRHFRAGAAHIVPFAPKTSRLPGPQKP
jgi:hypothetical protein